MAISTMFDQIGNGLNKIAQNVGYGFSGFSQSMGSNAKPVGVVPPMQTGLVNQKKQPVATPKMSIPAPVKIPSPGLMNGKVSFVEQTPIKATTNQMSSAPQSTTSSPQPTYNSTPQSTPTPQPISPATPQPSAFNANVQKLTDFGQGKETDGVSKAREDLKNFQTQYANQVGANSAAPIPLEFSQGRNQVLANQYNSALPAYQGAVTNSLESQSQQIGAAGTAGGLAQPVGQFGLLTNPQTGVPLNTGVFQSAIQQAIQLVNSGVGPNDPSVQALLSPFGFVGASAFTNAMQSIQGGGYNPQSLDTQANTNQTLGAQAQTQRFNLGTSLRLLDHLAPIAQGFIAASGLNSMSSPYWNQPINKYIATLGNTAAATTAATLMNDIKSVASQIIAAKTPGTPTNNDEMTAAQDPSLLNAKQLQTVLSNWAALGQIQSNVLGSQQSGAYGNTGGYTGGPSGATPTSLQVGAPNTGIGSGITNPLTQLGVGTGLGITEWAVNAASQLAPQILNSIVGGYTAGSAAAAGGL